MTDDELVSVPAAAQYLGIRPWKLRHWISARKIEVVKYGNGAVRIRRSVLQRFVTACTIKARARDDRRTAQSRLLKGPGVGSGDEPLAR